MKIYKTNSDINLFEKYSQLSTFLHWEEDGFFNNVSSIEDKISLYHKIVTVTDIMMDSVEIGNFMSVTLNGKSRGANVTHSNYYIQIMPELFKIDKDFDSVLQYGKWLDFAKPHTEDMQNSRINLIMEDFNDKTGIEKTVINSFIKSYQNETSTQV